MDSSSSGIMQIYVAYRTAYQSNGRQLAQFEASSVLDWFQTHWQTLAKDDYETLIGFSIYGLPLTDYDNVVSAVPTSIDELKTNMRKFAYCNEIEANEHCVEVFTDDDEIELAWYVFDDIYKHQHLERVSLWFTPKLPVTHAPHSMLDNSEMDKIKTDMATADILTLTLNGNLDANNSNAVYLMASPIYDGANITDTCVIRLLGVRLPEMIACLRESQSLQAYEQQSCHNYYSAIQTLRYLRDIANALDSDDITKIADVFNQYPATEIDLKNFDLATAGELSLGNMPSKSVLNIHDHMIELAINSLVHAYNYYVMFDDLWATAHPQLAKSLLRFGQTWRI